MFAHPRLLSAAKKSITVIIGCAWGMVKGEAAAHRSSQNLLLPTQLYRQRVV
ncbi:MAG: hypothetical protein H7Y09_13345 [Chitinophagaceae bacterium]|nr:hypothetical protein [Anaerolineae bacterium]